ncbi:MAG: M18 family aminopeptidase [Spirochaetales bacterium]|nr:M18 family aminopeptidase [Spirochaetales bacterium]
MAVESLINYLDQSPTAFHAVEEAVKSLAAAGFKALDETLKWSLEADTGYYVIRNGSSLIAFRTGSELKGETAFRIVTAHTDSPSFRLKEGVIVKKNGMLTVGVEVLGGPIFSTWLDRDLGIAGRVLVKDGQGGTETLLYHNDKRKVLIPNPPIHLNRSVNKGFEYNPQTHLSCILQSGSPEEDGTAGNPEEPESLYELIAADLNIDAQRIVDADLILYDTQKAALSGWKGEFLCSGRIDNLAMCHASLEAITDVKGQSAVTVAALFDNEETGSLTPHGADSSFLELVLERIVLAAGGNRESFMQSCASSFIVSADAAHAIHPNFADLYDEGFTPLMNRGPAVKKNAGWNYASTGDTAARYRLLCEKAGVPSQTYINRSDRPTGKTLGPLAAARLGIPAVDVGNPLWSMHSIRETVSLEDHDSMIKSFMAHYKEF